MVLFLYKSKEFLTQGVSSQTLNMFTPKIQQERQIMQTSNSKKKGAIENLLSKWLKFADNVLVSVAFFWKSRGKQMRWESCCCFQLPTWYLLEWNLLKRITTTKEQKTQKCRISLFLIPFVRKEKSCPGTQIFSDIIRLVFHLLLSWFFFVFLSSCSLSWQPALLSAPFCFLISPGSYVRRCHRYWIY